MRVLTGSMLDVSHGGTGASLRPEHLRTAQESLPALTSLRFIAALLVVLFHLRLTYGVDNTLAANLVAFGYTGVTFFFVLSGFILTHTYRAVCFKDQIALRGYAHARFARIYPLFLLSLMLSVPFSAAWIMNEFSGLLLRLKFMGFILAPLGFHSWIPGASCSLNCPSWSISTEIFFYAAFPFILPKVLAHPKRWLAGTMLCWVFIQTVVSLLWAQYGTGTIIDPGSKASAVSILLSEFIKFFPMVRVPEFIAGIILYEFWRRYRDTLQATPLLFIGAVIYILFIIYHNMIPGPVLHNGATILIWIPIILAGAQLRKGVLTSRVMTFLGSISFAFYLLQNPVFAALGSIDKRLLAGSLAATPWLGIVVSVIVLIFASACAYIFVEAPARRTILLRAQKHGAKRSP